VGNFTKTMNALKHLPLFFSILFLCGQIIAEESPKLIPFQGQLTNQEGTVYQNGSFSITFNLYPQPVGGTSTWTERHENLTVINGMVNAFLGAIESLASEDFSQALYLGITIDADGNPATPDPEMVPRTMILPAFHAKDSDKLAGYDWTSILVGQSNDPSLAQIKGSVLEDRGISGDKLIEETITGTEIASETLTIDKFSDSLTRLLVPVGSIISYGGPVDSIPSGWLYCDGRLLSKEDYTVLYNTLGQTWGGSSENETFNLPDLRGEFLRGVSDGTGRDPDTAFRTPRNSGGNTGDAVGTMQEHQFERHRHGLVGRYRDADTASIAKWFNSSNHVSPGHTQGPIKDVNITTNAMSATGGNETRPRNASVYFIIKAF